MTRTQLADRFHLIALDVDNLDGLLRRTPPPTPPHLFTEHYLLVKLATDLTALANDHAIEVD